MSAAAARAMARADELAACTERPGEITRRYGTPALVAGRDLLEAWMLEAGMRTRVDRAGNLIGTLAQGNRPGIVIGSHFDTVVDAGRYDGTLGILLGIGCAEELAGAGPAHDLTVVAFCDEEGVRFPTAYFGSRAFLGAPEPDGAMTDPEGATLASAIRNGYDRSLPTILDTHLTSILTAVVLYAFGNDNLKGFSVSLTVGLFISLFTSLYMTRLMFDIWSMNI